MRAVILGAVLLSAAAVTAQQPRPDAPAYETRFYRNGSLKLEAYFFKPSGPGPWPLVVYNHGSRANQERTEYPVAFIAKIMVPAGYALLVPERRGYGKADGPTFAEEIPTTERGPRFVGRLAAEASDVNAAIDDAKANLPVDPKRIVMMGYSFGGIVTTIGASDGGDLAAIVNQAPGALNWDHSPALRAALVAAATKIRAPMWCGAAENDATTDNARAICGAAKAAGAQTELKIYPPFIRANNPNTRAPGHAMFAPIGVDVWKQDVLDFLTKHVPSPR
jgi:carboxymethylenebutenolidase